MVQELTAVKKDLKLQKQQTSAVELRLNRALEDNEKLRNTAKQTHLQIKVCAVNLELHMLSTPII